MAVTIDGQTCSTLDDVVTVDDKRIVEIWADGLQVYPEPQTQTIEMRLTTNKEVSHLMTVAIQELRGSHASTIATYEGMGAKVIVIDNAGGLLDIINATKSFEAKYSGDITVTIESSKPLSQYVGHYDSTGRYAGHKMIKQVDTTNMAEWPLTKTGSWRSSLGYGATVGVKLDAQPFCEVYTHGNYTYKLTYDETKRIPMFAPDAQLTFKVSGWASCDYEFHDEDGLMQTEERTKKWNEHYKNGGKEVELVGSCLASSLTSGRLVPINGDKTLLAGSPYGSVGYREAPFYPSADSLIPLTTIAIARKNPEDPSKVGSIVCVFDVDGFRHI